MAIPTLLRIVALGGACLMPAACATSQYSQSRIETVPQGVKGRAGERAAFEVDGVKVRVASLDRVRRGDKPPSFSLRISFEPRELGYSFDPGQVVLRTADGREWRSRDSGYRLVQAHSSFDLYFDVAVEPKQQAALVVAGLARGTKALAPVALALGRHDGTSIDRIYWLEALGSFLAYAPYAR